MNMITWSEGKGFVSSNAISGSLADKPMLPFSYDALYYEPEDGNAFSVTAGVSSALTATEITELEAYIAALTTGDLLVQGVDTNGLYLGFVAAKLAANAVITPPPNATQFWRYNTTISNYALIEGVDIYGNYLGNVAFTACYKDVGSAPPRLDIGMQWDFINAGWKDVRPSADIAAEALASARAVQLPLISAACQACIYEGFTSSALGAAYHYPAKDKDQTNLAARVISSFYPNLPAGWTTAFICADSNGVWAYRQHTAAQIQQVGLDADTYIGGALLKNNQLAAQVNAATIDVVPTVVWSYP